MALTEEQQQQLEFQIASQKLHQKMEAVRIAKEVLMENDRNKPTGERGISPQDVVNFAEAIVTYVKHD